MKSYLYAVCPHCEHPNIHVEGGKLKPHTTHMGTHVVCLGSDLTAPETHLNPFRRGTAEYQTALDLGRANFSPPPIENARPAFTVWRFCGIDFIATPSGHGFHVMDALGANYGSWMDIEEFRKRQRSGILSAWTSLGRAHLSVICER